MRVGDRERFPHLVKSSPIEAQPLTTPVQAAEDDLPGLAPVAPEALRVADYSVVVEVAGELASQRPRQFFQRSAAVVPHPLFQTR